MFSFHLTNVWITECRHQHLSEFLHLSTSLVISFPLFPASLSGYPFDMSIIPIFWSCLSYSYSSVCPPTHTNTHTETNTHVRHAGILWSTHLHFLQCPESFIKIPLITYCYCANRQTKRQTEEGYYANRQENTHYPPAPREQAVKKPAIKAISSVVLLRFFLPHPPTLNTALLAASEEPSSDV